MVVAVVAAPVSSLLTHSFATGEAHAGFPSTAANHANGTAIRAPEPKCARPSRDARSDAQASRSIATTRSRPAQERPDCAPGWHFRPGRAARSGSGDGSTVGLESVLDATGLQLNHHAAMVARPPLIGIGIEGTHG